MLGLLARARTAVSSAGPGRRAGARPARRAADRAQPLSPSIRARSRPAPPGRSAGARPRRCSRATRRTTANGRSGSCSTSGAQRHDAHRRRRSRAGLRADRLRPTWDTASNRVGGFEILPLATLGRPRVDVTLRISGLFRDVFPSQIALFDAAVRAVAALEESAEDNPLAGFAGDGARRACSARRRAPMASASVGASPRATGRSAPNWREAYLAATSHAYDGEGEAREAAAAFRDRVAGAEAFVHVQDLPGQDVLDADAFAEHEGGFAAAAAALGATPGALSSRLDDARTRRKSARSSRRSRASLRARAANPRWLAGQMRHGHRGAAEIAETLDNLYRLRRADRRGEQRQFDLHVRRDAGRRGGPRLSRRGQRAAARHMAGVFDEAARRGFWRSRRNSCRLFSPRCRGRLHERLRRIEAGARSAAPQGLVSGRAAADGDRRRPAGAGARSGRAPCARPGDGDRGGRARVRQRRRSDSRRARNLQIGGSASGPSPICRRASRPRACSTPTPRSSGCATSSQVRLSDIDPAAALDIADNLAALEAASRRRPELCRLLPAKFGFVLDAGGRLPLGDVDADIRVRGRARPPGRAIFRRYLAGEDALAVQVRAVPTSATPRRGSRALSSTLPGRTETPRRMRALVERDGAQGCVRRGRGWRPLSGSGATPALRSCDVLGGHVFGVGDRSRRRGRIRNRRREPVQER